MFDEEIVQSTIIGTQQQQKSSNASVGLDIAEGVVELGLETAKGAAEIVEEVAEGTGNFIGGLLEEADDLPGLAIAGIIAAGAAVIGGIGFVIYKICKVFRNKK